MAESKEAYRSSDHPSYLVVSDVYLLIRLLTLIASRSKVIPGGSAVVERRRTAIQKREHGEGNGGLVASDRHSLVVLPIVTQLLCLRRSHARLFIITFFLF